MNAQILTRLFRLEQNRQALIQQLIDLMTALNQTEADIHNEAALLGQNAHIIKTDAGHYCIQRQQTHNRKNLIDIRPISTENIAPIHPITYLPNAFDS